MTFRNVYEDAARADAYSRLEFPGTYFLAYRDLPSHRAGEHVSGRRAVDFGCGAGRSTRFLHGLGFEVVGVDVSADMIRKAREIDPSGDYRRVEPARLGLTPASWDLVLSAFTFDNIPQQEKAGAPPGPGRRLLATEGRIVNLVSTPEIYTHEWASFSTRDFPREPGGEERRPGQDRHDRRRRTGGRWRTSSARGKPTGSCTASRGST